MALAAMTIDDQMRVAHFIIERHLVTDTMDDEPDLDDLEGDDWYGDGKSPDPSRF